jgi:hypothetical protein
MAAEMGSHSASIRPASRIRRWQNVEERHLNSTATGKSATLRTCCSILKRTKYYHFPRELRIQKEIFRKSA